MKYVLAIFLTALFCSISTAGTIDPKNNDSRYLDYGAKHECVLEIIGYLSDKDRTPYKGSCVMIDGEFFLTAAHMVKNSMISFVMYNDKPYKCSILIAHENFQENRHGFNDIAIGKLDEPICLDFFPELYFEKDELGKVNSQAGFGFTGNFINGYSRSNFDNKRRAGSNIICKIENNLLICMNNDIPNTDLEITISPGDSGGGLFIDKKLAGIHSCIYSTDGSVNSDYGDVSGHTRVSDFIDWIKNKKYEINNKFKK